MLIYVAKPEAIGRKMLTQQAMRYLVEHLPRIDTITVIVESNGLCSARNLKSQSVEIVDENGSSCKLELPHRIQINSGRKGLQISGPGCQTLRLRALKGADTENISNNRSVNDAMMLLPQKWMRSDLQDSRKFEIHCAGCHYSLISDEDCSKISDLPSEFWTELMDYWHCHKPTTTDDAKIDRYSRLQPLADELLVGSSQFQVSEKWGTGKLDFGGAYTRCAKCHRILGSATKDSNLYSINKWTVQLVKNGITDNFSSELHVVSTLLNNLNCNGTRIVNLKSPDGDCHLLVWIFVVNVNVTIKNNQIMTNCIKIYYKTGSESEQPSAGPNQNIDQVSIDGPVLKDLIEKLDSINGDLPSNARMMNSWKLGYLSPM
ncbi:LAFA_0F06216g1_1 [Lachancea sp. 'fantastica']|nr:LAFA_0F06216g1_1 [Lachancea sp. 'fantastica']